MKRKGIFIIAILSLIVLSTLPSKVFSATYYVRPDGGTAKQCTGLVDKPYPGSGINQPCAWSHPFWALKIEGGLPRWRLSSGDTLIIKSGSYMMGYGAPNTGWCDRAFSWDCVLPPLPSNVRILGEGWDKGCPNPPELWATERALQIFNLTGSNKVILACLDLTDHASCADFHKNRNARCQRENPPFGHWGERGIFAKDSQNVTLQDLNIHGFAVEGIKAGRISNWRLLRVRIAGNGWSGWDGDLQEDRGSSNSGEIRFSQVTIEWNGCVETYPDRQPSYCWAQSAGGYGDGVGTGRTGGHWIIEDSIFRYNTSDGLDLLYVGVGIPNTFVELHRVQAYGNAGNQIKIGGQSLIDNSLIIGNCNYFTGKPFAPDMGDVNSGDACRAGGASVSLSAGPNNKNYVVNNTIIGEGWAMTEILCQTNDFPDAPPCKGNERLYLVNNIFYAFPNVTKVGDWPDLIGDGDPGKFTRPETIHHNLFYRVQIDVPVGVKNINADPLFVRFNDINNIDAHLKIGSPAIDRGLNVGELGGRIPNYDLEGKVRPAGAGVDLGAYEFYP